MFTELTYSSRRSITWERSIKIKSKKKQFCNRGHDIATVGRDQWGKCIGCRRINQKKYNDRHKALKRKYRKKHKRHIKKLQKVWYEKNKKEILEKRRKYRKEHKQEISQRQKIKYNIDKEKIKRKVRKYRQDNKKEINKRVVERRKIDIGFRLKHNLRSRLLRAIKNQQKVGSAIKDLGCSIDFLIAYLQNTFYENMSWDNYGSYWVIDHVKALMFFNLSDRKQFLEACHYTNLQPLTIKDHIRKSAKEQRKKFN